MPVIYIMLMVVIFKMVTPNRNNSLSYNIQQGELMLLYFHDKKWLLKLWMFMQGIS